MNKRYKRLLDDVEMTQEKIRTLKEHLIEAEASLKAEEEVQMIKSIRSMKIKGRELFDVLHLIEEGKAVFEIRESPTDEAGEELPGYTDITEVLQEAPENEEEMDEQEKT